MKIRWEHFIDVSKLIVDRYPKLSHFKFLKFEGFKGKKKKLYFDHHLFSLSMFDCIVNPNEVLDFLNLIKFELMKIESLKKFDPPWFIMVSDLKIKKKKNQKKKTFWNPIRTSGFSISTPSKGSKEKQFTKIFQ